MTEITINRTCAILDRCEQFTSGRVGARIKFSFSSEWAGLSKTAVFTNGDTTIDVLNVADEITIPHEVLAISGKKLKVGVYGYTAGDNGNIEIAIPTVYAELGKVVKGADPSGDVSIDPTLPVWAQTQALIGNLNDLTTEAKNNLVAAINEAAQTGGGGGSTVELDATLTQSGKAADAKATGDEIRSLSEEKVNRSALSLGFGTDGKLYIMVSGVPTGNGVEINGSVEPSEGVVVFAADFSGLAPSADQFYSWEGRIYDNAIYDALQNIKCTNGVAVLTSVYDSANSRWIQQMMCTGGIFEADNFTCKFRAKFSGLAGSWNNIITYGTGTHWTNGVYSDGVKWPAGGEIDAFEQAGGYADVPNTMFTPTAHYGAGTESGYPNTHESKRGNTVEFTTDAWHDFKFSLNSGYVKVWIDNVLVGENDFSNCIVSNNYMADYAPFLKPQAFYIDGFCASGAGAINTSNVYKLEVSDFKIIQDAYVECAGLEIYPQMWAKGTELVFPVGAELYLDRVYTPANTSNKACQWESSNTAVATVVQGYVKILSAGTTTITATCGNAQAQYTVTAAEAANVPCVKIESKNNIGATVGDVINVNDYIYQYPSFTTDTITVTADNANVSINGASITMVSAGDTVLTVTVGAVATTLTINIASGAPELMMAHDFVVNGATNNGPDTYDVSFVADATYTIHYKIENNPQYTGTANRDFATRFYNASGGQRLPMILNKTDDTAEVTFGSAYPVYTYTPSSGDWITLVFTASDGKSGQVYINGALVKDGVAVYKDYVYIGESMRPLQKFNFANAQVKYCVGRIEVYRGDNHDLHISA